MFSRAFLIHNSIILFSIGCHHHHHNQHIHADRHGPTANKDVIALAHKNKAISILEPPTMARQQHSLFTPFQSTSHLFHTISPIKKRNKKENAIYKQFFRVHLILEHTKLFHSLCTYSLLTRGVFISVFQHKKISPLVRSKPIPLSIYIRIIFSRNQRTMNYFEILNIKHKK